MISLSPWARSSLPKTSPAAKKSTKKTTATNTKRWFDMPRWFHGVLAACIYIEMITIVVLKIHLPAPPDPVFKKPEPVEYHWVRGPYDDDWDYCWTDEHTGVHQCYTEDI